MCHVESVEAKATAGAPEHEIEVTPEMIEAGVKVMRDLGVYNLNEEEIVESVYVAMRISAL